MNILVEVFLLLEVTEEDLHMMIFQRSSAIPRLHPSSFENNTFVTYSAGETWDCCELVRRFQ